MDPRGGRRGTSVWGLDDATLADVEAIWWLELPAAWAAWWLEFGESSPESGAEIAEEASWPSWLAFAAFRCLCIAAIHSQAVALLSN